MGACLGPRKPHSGRNGVQGLMGGTLGEGTGSRGYKYE